MMTIKQLLSVTNLVNHILKQHSIIVYRSHVGNDVATILNLLTGIIMVNFAMPQQETTP